MHLADAQVGAGVERAPVGDRPGAGEQPPGGVVAVVRQTGEAADLLGHLVHLLARLEEALGVAAAAVGPQVAQVGGAERHQPPGGVEDVDGRGVEAVGVAHGVGQHRGQARSPGDAGHPGRVRRGARPPVAGTTAQTVRDQLDDHVLPGQHGQPGRERGQPHVVAAPRRGEPQLGGRPEQRQHVTAGQVRGQHVEGRDRPTALTREVDRRHHPAQGGPARPSAGQERHPGVAALLGREVACRAPAHRRTTWGRPAGTSERAQRAGRRHRQVDPQHRAYAGRAGRADELHRTVGAVAVGEGEGVHLLLDRALHQRGRVGRAELQRVAGGDVEVDEGVARHLTPRWRGAPGRATARSRPGTGRRRAPGRRPRARSRPGSSRPRRQPAWPPRRRRSSPTR